MNDEVVSFIASELNHLFSPDLIGIFGAFFERHHSLLPKLTLITQDKTQYFHPSNPILVGHPPDIRRFGDVTQIRTSIFTPGDGRFSDRD